MKSEKFTILSDYVINLFKENYQQIVDNSSNLLIDKFEEECFNKAKELGLDTDSLEFNGELLYFVDDESYKNSKKYFYINYYEKEIVTYHWI